MALNFSSITGSFFYKMLTTPLLWLVIVFVMGLATLGMMWLRKKRKLILPTLIVTTLGYNKVALELKKAGWFKKKSILFGLWDWKGEEILKTSDGRRIMYGSSDDFHDFKGKRALIVKRKSDDPKILVPIKNIKIENEDLIAEIAPADYRDASNEILKNAESEMREKWKQVLDYIMLGGILIFAFISIIMIMRMANQSQEISANLIKEVSQKCDCGGATFDSATAP